LPEGKDASELAGAAAEAASLVELLSSRHRDLCAVLEAPSGMLLAFM